MYVLAKCKGKTRLFGGLSKQLVLDGDVTDSQGVLGYEAFHRARTILDLECRAVGLVGRGLGVIILVVKEACNGSALHTRDPEIARPAMTYERLTDISVCWASNIPSIKNNLELKGASKNHRAMPTSTRRLTV